MGSISLALIPKVNCCCVGINLRVASLILGWLFLVSCVFISVITAVLLGLDKMYGAWKCLVPFLLICSLLGCFIVVLLLVGVNEKFPHLMRPGIVLYLIFLVCLLLSNIVWIVLIFDTIAYLGALIVSLVFTGVNMHWFQVLVSYYFSVSTPNAIVVTV